MKICLIAPYNVLSLDSGASRRVFGISKGLSENGSTVFVLHHGPSHSINSRLNFVKFRSFSPFLDGSNYFHPFNPYYFTGLSKFLKKYNPDIVQGEQPWSFFPTVFLTKKSRIPFVLDEHNVEFIWAINSSRIPLIASPTFIFEKFALSYSSLVLAVSETDKENLSQIYQTSEDKILVVPNGVDMERFSNMPPQRTLKAKLGLNSKSKIVLFHGLLSAKQNYEAVNLILEYLAPSVKDAKFIIIGKNPPKWLKERSKIQENTLLLGYVPRIEDYIKAADVCVVPIISGSGTRLKVIEYLAAGKPLVTTVKGCEGIGLRPGVHAKICEGVNECFILSLKELLSNERLANEMGSAGVEYAKRFDWKIVTSCMTESYLEIFEKRTQ